MQAQYGRLFNVKMTVKWKPFRKLYVFILESWPNVDIYWWITSIIIFNSSRMALTQFTNFTLNFFKKMHDHNNHQNNTKIEPPILTKSFLYLWNIEKPSHFLQINIHLLVCYISEKLKKKLCWNFMHFESVFSFYRIFTAQRQKKRVC
jgi:hypothetical protein